MRVAGGPTHTHRHTHRHTDPASVTAAGAIFGRIAHPATHPQPCACAWWWQRELGGGSVSVLTVRVGGGLSGSGRVGVRFRI